MNGNDDFFGGSVNPAPVPNANATREANIYAPPGSPAAPVQATSSPAILVILIVVGALVVVAAFLGYRAMTSGTNIVLPDELLGMERVDPDSQIAKEVENSWSGVETVAGKELELNVGTYMSDGQVLVVAAAETGLDDGAEQDDYFTGFAQGFGESMPQAEFAEVEAGSNGGRMQCVNIAISGQTAGACTWVSEDTIGMTMLIAPETDVADAARTVRSVIEK